MRNSQKMLILIRNNFPKECLVRFLTDLALKIMKWQQQNLAELPKIKREDKLVYDQAITLGNSTQTYNNKF
jgi:hypothetical protein